MTEEGFLTIFHMFLSIKRKIDYTFESVCFICLTIFSRTLQQKERTMAIDLWRHFKKGLMVYIGIGIAVSFLSAANVFYFQKLLDSFGKTLDWPVVFIYGLTLVLVPILSYLEQKPKTTLHNSMYFYLKEQKITFTFIFKY